MPKTNSDAEALYEHRLDEDEWEEAPELIEVRPKRTEVVSFRLPTEELDQLEQLALYAGMTISEAIRALIKRGLSADSEGHPPVPVIIDFMPGRATFLVNLHGYLASPRGESPAPSSWVPDYPPGMVNITSDDDQPRLDLDLGV